MSDSLNCLAYFYLRHIRGIVPEEPQLPLIFGSAIHAALAEKYRGKGFRDMCRAFDEVWLEGSQGRKDAKRNAARGLAILTAYQKRYPKEQFEVLCVEESFMVPVGQLALVGVIDLVAKMGSQILVIDHKTSSSLSPYYWLPYLTTADYQGAAYLYAVSTLMRVEAKTFVPNVLLVNDKREEFERRFCTYYDQAAFQKQLLHWHKALLWHHSENCWPKNPKFCNRWAKCSYAGMCEVYPDVTNVDLISGYRIEHWDPVARLKE
jgi:hypothetical protein